MALVIFIVLKAGLCNFIHNLYFVIFSSNVFNYRSHLKFASDNIFKYQRSLNSFLFNLPKF